MDTEIVVFNSGKYVWKWWMGKFIDVKGQLYIMFIIFVIEIWTKCTQKLQVGFPLFWSRCKLFIFNWWLPGVGAGETQADGVINQTSEHQVTGLGLNPIETKPNQWQTFVALLRLRVLRMFRDIQKLYFTVLLPLGFAACGLYIHSIQSTDPKMKSLVLNGGD